MVLWLNGSRCLLAASSPMESLQNLRFHSQRRRGPSQLPCRTRRIRLQSPQRCLPPCRAQEAALILWPPPPDGDTRGLDSGGRWHRKDEALSMKVKDITKSTLGCQQWRGRGRGGGADISRLPSNTENPLVNDYWFSLWWKMGHGCGEFISAGGNGSPTSKRPSRSTCRSALCF